MTDTNPSKNASQNKYMNEMNDAFIESLERNVEAQTAFVDSWMSAFDTTETDEKASDGMNGYIGAYEAWMDAAQKQFERINDALDGEDVPIEEFRDIWLKAANDAFKEVTTTSEFASMTADSVENSMAYKQTMDEATEQTLGAFGLPTETDIQEIGERLVEVERRQHDIERKLDRVLDVVESE
ncbi:poly(R)-hydroxyalkanoic acid synthase subunit PhaE [Haladaptatus caseinilyticus]|uniref:poly(R)-hydroxyalkanoic acid synthase subunit PhaE n=1 Tax=Haladaptatus caseinilyticus TaxID=2993314 RepID=UPI00224A98DE|nr:poly(R)-hydroxyalkanoic acid synthase subunit PhaE [Haladaptatus caseinilyticus]